MHQKEAIYGLCKESKFFHKFTKYGLFNTLQASYILILVSFIYLIKEKLVSIIWEKRMLKWQLKTKVTVITLTSIEIYRKMSTWSTQWSPTDKHCTSCKYTKYILYRILKNSNNLWNSTLVLVEDKLSSTTVDFIRSDWKLKTKCLY